MLREKNKTAVIITTDWNALNGAQILEAMEHRDTLEAELKHLSEDEDVCPVCGHHHHDDDDDEHEHHHHHHDDDDDDDDDDECGCGCHHHHDDDDDDDEHEHEHEHEHHHHHHHGHDADEVFVSWGVETPKKFTVEELETKLDMLENAERFGAVLRAKGIVAGADGKWIHFDYVPGEKNIRYGSAGVTGRLCVIGSKLNEAELTALFGV